MHGLRLVLAFQLLALLALASPVGAHDISTDTNLSGIACGTATSCLVIDNEGRSAQWATLDPSTGKLTGGELIDLVKDDYAPEDVTGDLPKPDCGADISHFGALDGEAVAYADGIYYVTGSHGCTRSSDKQKLSAFLVTRIVNGTVERSFRLNEAIEAEPTLFDDYGKELPKGLSIEGLAVKGDELVFGFRSPKPYLLYVNTAALFTAGADLAPHCIELDLKDHLGVRDLAPLGGDQLLVLAGPEDGDDDPFIVYLVAGTTSTKLTTVPSGKHHHPEGMQILDIVDGKAHLLILNDGTEGGEPRIVMAPP